MVAFAVTTHRKATMTASGRANLRDTNNALLEKAKAFSEGDWVLLNGSDPGKIRKRDGPNFSVQRYSPDKKTRLGHPKWYGVNALSKPDS